MGAAAALVLLSLGWLTWSGFQARSELNAARRATQQLRTALLASDDGAARTALAAVTSHADRAQSLTSGPLWAAASSVPYLGRTPDAVSQTADVIAEVSRDVLPGLVGVARSIDPTTLRKGDSIDITAIASAGPAVTRLAGLVEKAGRRLAQIQLDWVPRSVHDGVMEVRTEVLALTGQLDAARTATTLLPPMLGADLPRRYLVVFQNNAEARGTGGLVGAFGVVQATKGRLTVVRLGSDDELKSAKVPVVDLGPAYRALFGVDPALWPNTNVSAHFPSAAVQQLELWRLQFGERLDGVIAIDPVALGYLLGASGPATLPGGEQVTGTNVADLTMRAVYARFAAPSQVQARKAFLQVVASAALQRLLTGGGSARGELDALGRAAGERRLLVYSTQPAEERLLGTTALGGVVDARPGPYAALAVDNAAGNKLDYYLDRHLAYQLDCPSGGSTGLRTSTITVTLRDGAPPVGLPAYAAYRLDRGPLSSPLGRGGDGSTRLTVLVYAAAGGRLMSATLDGLPLTVTPGSDGARPGRPVFVFSVELTAGQQRVAVLRLDEPVTGLEPRSWVQPLVRAATSTVTEQSCR